MVAKGGTKKEEEIGLSNKKVGRIKIKEEKKIKVNKTKQEFEKE